MIGAIVSGWKIETWAWLLLPLGMTRAVQIALHDRVFKTPRAWLLHRLNPDDYGMNDPRRSYLSYLLECPWCMSVWVAGVVVLLLVNKATCRPTLWVMLVLALSLLAVVIDRLIDVYASDEAAEARARAALPPAAAAVVVTPGADVAIPSPVEAGFRRFESDPDPTEG